MSSRSTTMTALELVLKVHEEANEVTTAFANQDPKVALALELADLEYYLAEIRKRAGLTQADVRAVGDRKLSVPYQERNDYTHYRDLL